MDLIESLDQEVDDIVAHMAPQMIILLLEKWDRQIEFEKKTNAITISKLCNHYVRLKIGSQRLKRGWFDSDFQYMDMTEEQFIVKMNYLDELVKKSRRDYYVAKRRNESEHNPGCSCRGCRCIKDISGPPQEPGSGCIGGAGDVEESRSVG